MLAGAQQLELRGDVLGPAPASVQPGIGWTFFAGYYGRVTADAGYAPAPRADLIADHWRGDVITRFVFDPFRQQRWGLSLGGGLSFRKRTYLAVVIDLEGPEVSGFLPALQLGVSGGVRGAVILRRARPARR
jgi:hypothetical protein